MWRRVPLFFSALRNDFVKCSGMELHGVVERTSALSGYRTRFGGFETESRGT